jgi:hypothetical protein
MVSKEIVTPVKTGVRALCVSLNLFGYIPRGLPRFYHSGKRETTALVGEPTSLVGQNPEKERLDAGSSPA